MSRALTFTVLAAALAVACPASAQTIGSHPEGFLGGLFGGDEGPRPDQSGRVAQMSESDVVVRLDRLEEQIRQLTGSIEQLQFHNQQLEQTVRKMQEEGAYGAQGPAAARPTARQSYPQQQAYPQQSYPQQSYPQQSYPQQSYPRQSYPQPNATPAEAPAAPTGRRSDVFDPTLHPNAPGAPRQLGGGGSIAAPEPEGQVEAPPVGMPGGRDAGAPLDLSTLSAPPGGAPPMAEPPQGGGPETLPPPPPRNISGTGATAALQTQPPTRSPKDEYELAYGYMLHKDYALAETAFKNFLQQHPGDRLASDATYWLGESMFQRQRYRDAAESFLAVTTKHDKSAKAPDALFRLGQSLAALGEKEAACAALGEVGRKYPRASSSVKQGVTREQKRVHC